MPTAGDDLRTDPPPGLSQPALRALAAAGIERLDQLTEITERELLALHGMGPKGVRVLRAALRARGLDLREAKRGG